MGSLQGVAETKGAIYDALPAEGVAVVNADDAFALHFIARLHGRRIVCFGIDADADVQARDIHAGIDGSRFTLHCPQGQASLHLSLPGRHNVRNALAAAAMAMAAGATLAQVVAGLETVEGVAGRLARHRLRGGALLIDDSYNANPGSLAAAIDTLGCGEGEAWLVLGDMRELGADEAALHAEAGSRAKRAGIARLYTLGALSAHAAQAFGEGAHPFANHAALAEALQRDLQLHTQAGVAVLVKGSRGSAMDKIVKALLQRDAAGGKEITGAA
jgi:UDP-N-acetylmuramoyl-tripeptide--D-alanyl-D-alanine ligase